MTNAHYNLLKNKLLPMYRDAFAHSNIVRDVSSIKLYLRTRSLDMGICHAAKENFHEFISETDWIQPFKRTFMGFWAPAPGSAVYFSGIQNRLLVRIEIMEQLVANYEKGMTERPYDTIIHNPKFEY